MTTKDKYIDIKIEILSNLAIAYFKAHPETNELKQIARPLEEEWQNCVVVHPDIMALANGMIYLACKIDIGIPLMGKIGLWPALPLMKLKDWCWLGLDGTCCMTPTWYKICDDFGVIEFMGNLTNTPSGNII